MRHRKSCAERRDPQPEVKATDMAGGQLVKEARQKANFPSVEKARS